MERKSPAIKSGYAPWFLIIVGALVYANSLSGPFIYDDILAIVDNDDIRQFLPLWRPGELSDRLSINSRPVVRFSLALNYAISGLDVRGYHVLNIAVHILCALVLFGVVRRTLAGKRLRSRLGGKAGGMALAGALLWMVHPLQSQCVNYITQRSESIMALFYLLVLYCFIRGIDSGRRRWYGAAVLACALGMASKEVMVTAPLMVLLYDRVFQADSLAQALRQRGALYAGLAATWPLLAFLVWSVPHGSSIGFAAGVGGWNYALNQCIAIVDYLRLSFWPHPLILDYGYPQPLTLGAVLPQAVVVIALLISTAVAWFYQPMLGFPGAWFFVILGPTSSFVPFAGEVGAERRMYLPLAGLIVILVITGYVALERAVRRWRIDVEGTGSRRQGEWAGWLAVVLTLGIASILGGITVRRNRDYQSAVSIWQTVVDAVPGNPRGHSSLGAAFAEEGRMEEALRRYRQALLIRPDHADAHFNLANAFSALGEVERAIYHFRRAVHSKPVYAEAHNNLGLALHRQGRLEEAIHHFRRALQLRPDYAKAHNNLGLAYRFRGDIAAAIRHYRQALRLKSDFAEAHYNLGIAFESQGDTAAAIRHYRQALRLKPDFVKASNNLAAALGSQGEAGKGDESNP